MNISMYNNKYAYKKREIPQFRVIESFFIDKKLPHRIQELDSLKSQDSVHSLKYLLQNRD